VEKRGQRGNFHCNRGKKYHFGKMGGGAKISIIWIIYTPGEK